MWCFDSFIYRRNRGIFANSWLMCSFLYNCWQKPNANKPILAIKRFQNTLFRNANISSINSWFMCYSQIVDDML